MSDGEVKRWWIEDNEANETVPAEVAKNRYIEVLRVADHERIVAERDELWKRATKFVMPGEMDTGESIEHYIKTLEQTIARQARVIEKLKERLTSWISETHPNDEHLRNMCLMVEERELAAIEKGEA